MRNRPRSSRIPRRVGIAVVSVLISTVATAGVGVWTTNGPPNGTGSSVVIADPERPGTLYAGESSAIAGGIAGASTFKSTDDGVTWTLLNFLVENPTPLATAPPDTVYLSNVFCGEGTCNGFVSVSSDGGVTWRNINGNYSPQTVWVVVDPVTPTTLFLGQSEVPPTTVLSTFSSLLKSTDGGATWAEMDKGLGLISAVISSMIVTKVSGTLYVATLPGHFAGPGYPPMPGLFKTVDGGSTWTQLRNAPSLINVLAADPTNRSIIYAGTDSGVFKSVDGGATFAPMNAGLTNASVSSFAINPVQSTNVFVGTTTGGVFVSVDGGATWRSLNNGLTDLNVNTLAIDSTGGFLHAGTSTGVFDYQLALSSCSADAHTLCLNNGRFSVSADFQQTPQGLPVQATAVPLTNDTGYFWFFDPTNIELVTKVLTGCGVNNSYWVFAGGLTDVGVEMKVTDTATGAFQTYSNAFGTPYRPIQDSSAFPCP
jgi:hypothetical protein